MGTERARAVRSAVERALGTVVAAVAVLSGWVLGRLEFRRNAAFIRDLEAGKVTFQEEEDYRAR